MGNQINKKVINDKDWLEIKDNKRLIIIIDSKKMIKNKFYLKKVLVCNREVLV